MGVAEITAVFTSKKEIVIKGKPAVNLPGMNGLIESRLSNFGYEPEVISTEPVLVVRMKPLEVVKENGIPWLNILLFTATVISTLLAGALWAGIDIISRPTLIFTDPWRIVAAGFPFSVSLLSILLFHEFGHFYAARLHRVNVSWPYFIPGPTVIGTFGAFIKSKSAFMNKRQLLDVAAAGPLAGLIISIVVLAIGTQGSSVQEFPQGAAGIYFGESLLHRLIIFLVKGPIPEGQVLVVNSIALAGWVGLLVTMFNLLPIGQLDGGHIMYALFDKAQRVLAYVSLAAILVLSFWWPGWAFWLVLTALLRPAHPPTIMDEVPLDATRRIVGYLSIAAFAICFMPVPVSF